MKNYFVDLSSVVYVNRNRNVHRKIWNVNGDCSSEIPIHDVQYFLMTLSFFGFAMDDSANLV